ncbi:MAG TPA: hypothetical protein VMU43_09170, partial [Candidatus Acidoferrum sp.]|nr:hypothetical protein [Candidatus Acidoferrum sp.]
MNMRIRAARPSAEGAPFALAANRRFLFATMLLTISASLPCAAQEAAAGKCPPPTKKDNVVDTYFGVKVPDPYRWLEDQESPETRAWIDAEDKCTDTALKNLPTREGITKRLGELLKVDSVGVPRVRNGKYFFAKRSADQDLYVIYERNGANGQDKVLVDPAPLSADHSTSVNLADVSHDGSLIAYEIRTGGQDETTVHFRTTETKKDLSDELPKAVYFGLEFTPDGKGVYYARTTEKGPRLFYHAMGTDAATDKLIFGEGYGKDKII